MKTEKIKFKSEDYFPKSFSYLGFILIPFGLFIFPVSGDYMLSLISILLSILFIKSHYLFSIDLENKAYCEFMAIFGLKFGEPHVFEKIEHIFINKHKIRFTFNTRIQSSSIVVDEYRAFIKFSEADKVFILSDEKKERLLKKLNKYFGNSDIAILDNTVTQIDKA